MFAPFELRVEAVVLVPGVVQRRLVLVAAGGQRRTCPARRRRPRRRSRCVAAQAGSQSPAQPASDWSEPAIVTDVGFGVCDAVAAGSSTSAAAASAVSRRRGLLAPATSTPDASRETTCQPAIAPPHCETRPASSEYTTVREGCVTHR